MSEFKGTKGSWEKGDLKISVWGEGRKGCIADCSGIHKEDFYTGFTKEEMLFNAQLISCAPEILEALKVCLSELKQNKDAIAVLMEYQDGWDSDYERLIGKIEKVEDLIQKATTL